MKKRILGIKIGRILTGLLCLAVAFAFWFFVKYANNEGDLTKDPSSSSSVYEQ